MNARPMPGHRLTGREAASRLVSATAARIRKPPTPGAIARRHAIIALTKWILPIGALALLAAIALWPEINRATDQARVAFRRVAAQVEGGRIVDAHYKGIDERGRPYTVTASEARQVAPDRIDLVSPKADIALENGVWLMLQSKAGVYMQAAGLMDLSKDVVLYRDDGTTATTSSAAIDLKNGVASGNEPIHVEGPFGTIDAAGFVLVDKGAAIEFAGPANALLNAGTAQ